MITLAPALPESLSSEITAAVLPFVSPLKVFFIISPQVEAADFGFSGVRQPVNPKPNGLSQNPDEIPQPMKGVLFWAKKSLAPRKGVITGTAAKIWSS